MPETISMELFKLRIYERIHIILQEWSMYWFLCLMAYQPLLVI